MAERKSITAEAELEDILSTPSPEDVNSLAALSGTLAVLGAGGKMGPSLVRRARRAAPHLRVIAVARFTDQALPGQLQADGIETVTADLLDREQVQRLPDAENVIFMAGRKFGSTGNEALTWAVNAWTPGLVAERYARSRIVAFSTGNVYPLLPLGSGGAVETTALSPIGEYAQSALARERIFEYFSHQNGTPVLLLRLNYAIDLRYGVLLDIGQKVYRQQPVDVTMGFVNVIWQGDANSVCLRSFPLCGSPARVLNLTGSETLSVRWIARQFGAEFDCQPRITGEEAENALLSNALLCHELLGPPSVPVEWMISWVADWIKHGGPTLDKPTHFETRTGKF